MRGLAQGHSGYALVAVLWLITLLTIMTASYHSTARREAQVLVRSVYETQARARAEAAIWIALNRRIRSGHREIAARSSETIEFDGTPVEVTVVEETARVNLNRTREEALGLLLAGAGLGENERTALVDAILDWRDEDDSRRTNGAEDADYAAAGHGANDSFFATVDELRHVRGMTDSVFRQIEGSLTVYGDHTQVSAEAADPELLLSLSDNDEAAVEAFIRQREGEDGRPPRLGGMSAGLVQRVRGDVYRARSTATAGSIEATVEATLQLPRRGNAVVSILAWQ